MRSLSTVDRLLVASLVLVASAAHAQSTEPLPLGAPLQRAIADGPPHVFTIDLALGQYLEVALFQRGRDVALTLSDAGGRVVVSAESPLGFGPESLSTIATLAGEYRLIIRP